MTFTLILLAAIFGLGWLLNGRCKRTSKPALENLPRVGFPRGPLAGIRGALHVGSLEKVMHDAYIKYGCAGLAFITTGFLWPARVVLPSSMIPWIQSQPEEVLSFAAAVDQTLTFGATSLDVRVMDYQTHPAVVRGPLTRSLIRTPPTLLEEIAESFDRVWGRSHAWQQVDLFHGILYVTARACSRIFLSSDLCRNEQFVDATREFAESLAMWGVLLRLWPCWLRDRLSWLLLLPHRRCFQRLFYYLEPVIESRKRIVAQEMGSASTPDKNNDSNDLLHWLVQSAYDSQDPHEWETQLIAKRYAVVMFAALHTTAWAMSNLLLDILAADPAHALMDVLRDEASTVFEDNQQQWSKSNLARLVRMDSTVRESLRFSPISSWALHRLVVSKSGLELPNGVHLPLGTMIIVSSHEIMRDESNYPQGSTFDPYRFCRSRPISKAAVTTDDSSISKDDAAPSTSRSKVLSQQGSEAVALSSTYLSFGLGRHACPGRFFAVQKMKLMLIHILKTYELERLPQRPPEKWLGSEKIPDMNVRISIRLQQDLK